jgi:hypothetical protein
MPHFVRAAPVDEEWVEHGDGEFLLVVLIFPSKSLKEILRVIPSNILINQILPFGEEDVIAIAE